MLPLADAHTVWVQVVFLDDFGSNLKPARDMGMVTILVRDTDTALRELEKVTGTQVTLGLSRVWLPAVLLVFGEKSTRRPRYSLSPL